MEVALDCTTMRAGTATVDITPPVGLPLGGYAARREPSNSIRDPLRARVLLLESEGTRLAIVTLDLLGLEWELAKQMRKLMVEKAGLLEEHILVNCSHTHAGPELRHESYAAYAQELVAKVAGAALMAGRCVVPATITYAEDAIDFNVNRRRKAEDGQVHMAPNREGPVDRRVRVLRIDSERERPLAVLFHAVCHANALRGDNLAIRPISQALLRICSNAYSGQPAHLSSYKAALGMSGPISPARKAFAAPTRTICFGVAFHLGQLLRGLQLEPALERAEPRVFWLGHFPLQWRS